MSNVSSSNSQGVRVPKLRFPGFEGEWETQKLCDFTERITRKNSDNQSQLPLTISSKDGLVDQVTYFNKQVSSKDMSGYYLLKNGEFAYNKSYSVGYDFGSIKRLDRYPMGALSTLYICFALTKHNSDFMKVYFDSLKWYKEIYMIAAEGARNHGLLNVPTDDFFDTLHILPKNSNEQDKIAKFLILVEKRIEKQQALVDNLKSYKRGLYNHIFHSKIYQFEKHKLSDFARVYGGYAFDSKTYVPNGLYKVITIGNVTSARYVDLTDTKFMDHIPFDLQRYQRLVMGDIVISMTGNVGRASIVNKKNCLLNQRVAKLEFYNSNYKELIFQILSCGNFTLQMEQQGQGAAQKNIKNSDIENYEFYAPMSLSECKNIALLLSSIDAIIESELHKQQLLSILKSALLQQLFI